jgi:hypothetical protein
MLAVSIELSPQVRVPPLLIRSWPRRVLERVIAFEPASHQSWSFVPSHRRPPVFQ